MQQKRSFESSIEKTIEPQTIRKPDEEPLSEYRNGDTTRQHLIRHNIKNSVF